MAQIASAILLAKAIATSIFGFFEIALGPEPLPEIQARIAELVMPPTIATTEVAAFNAHCAAGGPWIDG